MFDPGREFVGEVTREMTKHDVRIRRGDVNVHRDQGIVELTRKKPMDAIKDKSVDAKSSTTYSRPVGFKEKRSDSSKNVYAVSEPEGDQRRVTDPIWSLKVFNIEKLLVKKGKPVLYCLKDGPKRGFVREELQIVPPGTELPPEGIR
ncbi:unnamed protein product [Pocillopora meandrina]|uniref:Uncharacterized protein n=1 Tax=Pocillopora meandrina TaxID=46732 RepID=A0AAU9WRU8_9CNID|nr:unnamed protein product [Pocillopora meandrina]